MPVLKTRLWWPQLFKDVVSGVPWDEAVKRQDDRILKALCGPWGRMK